MKIGIGQINTRVGDIDGNCEKIFKACSRLAEGGADLAVFPEMAVSGYPLRDLAFCDSFLDKAKKKLLEELAPRLPIPALIGCPMLGKGSIGRYNAAFWIQDSKVKAVCEKHLLPNYGVLNDSRNYDSSDKFCSVEFLGKKIGITICEDIWTLPKVSTSSRYDLKSAPLPHFKKESENGNLDLLINISASVFSSSNDDVRAAGGLLEDVSKELNVPLVWCNLVGGNDNLIFAGGSGVFDARSDSPKSSCLAKFSEDEKIVDPFELPNSREGRPFSGMEETRKAIVMSIRDFVQKCGFKKALIGLSGGIDSALVAALATEALGPENVIGVGMPSAISSDHSKEDAKKLAENLGIEFHMVGVADIVSAAESSLKNVFSGKPRDVTEENIQSRARGLVMMAMSNKFGAMVLTTGNKSECAVGYCTLYGDTCGGFAPISDLYKTEVYEMSRLINSNGEIIPQNTIDKPPSAELRPGQKDEDSLPPYDILDAILKMRIEEFNSETEIVSAGFDREVVRDVLKKLSRAEYKRSQYPIGPKVSPLAFSERNIPVAKEQI